MNFITKGDFAITNFQGNTTMSFRVPSLQKLDFVRVPGRIRALPTDDSEKSV